ncbi:MAG: hypothetical protein AAFQ02_06060 [Bacteroidota bacterium]
MTELSNPNPSTFSRFSTLVGLFGGSVALGASIARYLKTGDVPVTLMVAGTLTIIASAYVYGQSKQGKV